MSSRNVWFLSILFDSVVYAVSEATMIALWAFLILFILWTPSIYMQTLRSMKLPSNPPITLINACHSPIGCIWLHLAAANEATFIEWKFLQIEKAHPPTIVLPQTVRRLSKCKREEIPQIRVINENKESAIAGRAGEGVCACLSLSVFVHLMWWMVNASKYTKWK